MNTSWLSAIISLVILNLLNGIRSEVQITRVKDDNGGKDWIYEVKGDQIISEYRDGEIRPKTRSARSGAPRAWPSGTISYAISQSFNQGEQNIIKRAIYEVYQGTGGCVTFTPYKNGDKEYVMFQKVSNKGDCRATLGHNPTKGVQSILLGSDCVDPNAGDGAVWTVVHEMLHCLGFSHEMSRSDRDKYVQVHNENIDPNYRFAYAKEPSTNNEINAFDYFSVMMYGTHDFTSNGKETITPRQPGVTLNRDPNHKQATKSDWERVRKLYNCV